MRAFHCRCDSSLYFDNDRCLSCGAAVAFDPAQLAMRPLADDDQPCANRRAYGTCNWLATTPGATLCDACRLTEVVPDLSAPRRLALYYTVEKAKRRLLYSLLAFRLPLTARTDSPCGLAFHILADARVEAQDADALPADAVITGHLDGCITINLLEADPALREQMRTALNEPYRTVLGHFRHESGHYYWQRLVTGAARTAFREIFGDERQPYAECLAGHYRDGPPPTWPEQYVCAYAACHPLEDFAECWAHYLHIVDTLETAAAAGIGVCDRPLRNPFATPPDAFDDTLADWQRLATPLNDLNRSLGLDDAYPFALPPPVVAKLKFVHNLIANAARHPTP